MQNIKNRRYSFIYTLSKITLTLNIIVFILGLEFLYQTNNLIISDVSDPAKKILLIKLNQWIIIVGVTLIVLNIFVIIGSFIYSNRKYFKILDLISFDKPENSIKILDNISLIDEYGFLGEHIKKLLTCYIEFSYSKISKINEDERKINFLLTINNKPIIISELVDRDNGFKIVNLNKKVVEELSVDSKSSILGDFEKIIHPDSLNEYKDFINSVLKEDCINDDIEEFVPYNKSFYFLKSYYDKVCFNVSFYFFKSDYYEKKAYNYEITKKIINSMIVIFETPEESKNPT
ncbi:MAG TPA: hypothetical protein PKW55_01995 [Spirochaetota bacterium]|nr:hypothetical protein [Spirochaetota bacterium]HOM38375.1 hypothetical protein [Spirochaetota bacterium]HPQ48407.1 hypothetical protein [Spirochaetota bacterium]